MEEAVRVGLATLVIFLLTLPSLNCYDNELEANGVFPSKKHSLSKPYQGNGPTLPNWNFYGSTMLMSDYIRLTPDKPGKRGGLFNTVPLESPFWELHSSFRIYGSSRGFSGDGMAFWYTTTPLVMGEAFGANATFNGLSVMLDTYSNTLHKHSFPFISVMVNNGSLFYDHDKDGSWVSYLGCEAPKMRNTQKELINGLETVILIRYDRDELIVKMDFEGKNQWTDCLTLSGVQLPSHGYFGISASTGDLSDNHEVLWMKVHELEDDRHEGEDEDGRRISDADPYAVNKRLFVGRKKVRRDMDDDDNRRKIVPSVNRNLNFGTMLVGGDGDYNADGSARRMSNLSIFIVIFFTMLAFIFLAAMGWLYYQNVQERNRKRFY